MEKGKYRLLPTMLSRYQQQTRQRKKNRISEKIRFYLKIILRYSEFSHNIGKESKVIILLFILSIL
jgi:hypothetical protein